MIPAFVFRAIKSDSPTGFFRNPYNINQRVQDGDKTQLLCAECEQRFALAENMFATEIFLPFHQNDCDEFSYGPWLQYFLTSLAWRTLVLDLPGFESNREAPKDTVTTLVDVGDTMRNYLMGAENLAGCIRNHVVVWTKGDGASPQLAAAGPNVMIRRSAFGHTVLTKQHGYSGILHNLAGFMCFLIVKGDPRDNWIGTKVRPSGGDIKQPQQVDSWLMQELLERVNVCAQKGSTMSQTQQKRFGDAMRKNPQAKALRFHEWDREVKPI